MTLPSQLVAAFPKRPMDLHKYSAGTVTIVGGSSHFIHAPVIAGLGARAAERACLPRVPVREEGKGVRVEDKAARAAGEEAAFKMEAAWNRKYLLSASKQP